MSLWDWLCRWWWWVPLSVVAVTGAWAAWRTLRSRMAHLKDGWAGLNGQYVSARAKIAETELESERAKQVVKDTYRQELEQLDAKQKAEAKILENDPAALARFLVRSRPPK